MVIDDSNTIRRSAEIFLKQAVMKSYSRKTASTRWQRFQITTQRLFLSTSYARLDGYQTCSLIKKNSKFKATPVIMLSSKDSLFDRARGRMVGSDDTSQNHSPKRACCARYRPTQPAAP